MESLSKYIQERGVAKASLTRYKKYAENPELISNIESIRTLVDKHSAVFDRFDHVQTRIELLVANTEQAVTHESERMDFELAHLNAVGHLQGLIKKLEGATVISSKSTATSSSETTDSFTELNLPTINLPTFDGNYGDWVHFRDSFSSMIDNKKNLSNLKKLHYLNSALNGEPKNIIKSVGVSGSNYETAWNCLKKRYEDPKTLINHHIDSIVQFPKIMKESHKSLRQLIDETNSHIVALRSLNETMETLGEVLLVYLLVQKLNTATKKEWDREQSKLRVRPSFDSIMDFLESHSKFLESSAIERQSTHKPQVVHNTRRQNEKPTERSRTFVGQYSVTCVLCKGGHPLYSCVDFLNLTPSDRIERVRQLKICFNCLQPGHMNRTCTRSCCRKCSKKHHTLMHLDTVTPADNQVATTSSEKGKSLTLHRRNISGTARTQPLLATAIVYVQDRRGNKIECRALLDSGSQMNFITEDCIERLNLSYITANLQISGIGRTVEHASRKAHVTLTSRYNSYCNEITSYIIPMITENLPNELIKVSFPIPKGFDLADPNFYRPGKIDLLLGAAVYWDILREGQHRLWKNCPTLQRTVLGWIMGVTKFWEIEHVTEDEQSIDGPNKCEEHFVKTTTRGEDGRFIVSIPLKTNVGTLGDSRAIAEKRLYALERKLGKNPELRDKYSSFMQEYEALGHMSHFSPDTHLKIGHAYYLPHHAVFKESSTTTKVRVVFDGSAKTTTGISLNDVQMVGPNVQDDLFAIVTRFRRHRYVISADVEKMYRQVMVKAQDRSLQRILWRSHPSQQVMVYELNTVTYGTASAPFLATRALKELGLLHKMEHPKASRAILKDFYVDDLLTGANSILDTQKSARELSNILQSAGFELRKWATNDTRILNNMYSNDLIEISVDKDPKTLGLIWDPRADILKYFVQLPPQRNITKRTILSDISRIYDPLGLVGPVIVQAKILLQRLWQLKLSWDQSLPHDLHYAWTSFRDKLHLLNDIQISRHAIAKGFAKVEMHGFCDASEQAYGACIYLRSVTMDNRYILNLLCAKSRVAPLKTISLPRLELCSAVLLAQLAIKVKLALDMTIEEEFYWSHSKITLAWINSSPTRWKTFVANRVSEIQRTTNLNWHHVSSSDNPADVISRGINPASLASVDLWWKGPEWLMQTRNQWPSTEIHVDDIPAMKPEKCLTAIIIPEFELFNRYSSFTRLLRVTGYCLRYINNCRKQGNKNSTLSDTDNNSKLLTALELSIAEDTLIRTVQRIHFAEELNALQSGSNLLKSSRLASLNPFLDKGAIIRVGGRLRNAQIPYDQKHQAILPSKHPFTTLLIRHEHERLLHGGCQATVASLRMHYWPLSCRVVVKRVIRNCVKCFRAKPNITTNIMGDLPASRVSLSRPFQHCGVDYAGPFLLRERGRGRTTMKSYICIFVCFVTKATHIELAIDLSSDAFLNCFRRFISRRGICTNIHSDNGTNFIGAKNELRDLGVLLNDQGHIERVTAFCDERKIQWHLIPPRAPHFGGLWEGAVKAAKYHLKRVVGETKLTYEEFYTVLTQVEACLNSRPLSPLSNDPDDLLPLTPGHFLIGEPLAALPHPDLRDIRENRLSRYQHLQQMLQHFWHRWNKEYLHQLQQRHKWRIKVPTKFGVGTLVVLKDDNLPPIRWNLGRITDLHPGKDGVARVVSVKVADGLIKRPITKLCILPMETNDISHEDQSEGDAASTE